MPEVDEWIESTYGDKIDEIEGLTLQDLQEVYDEEVEEYGEKVARVSVKGTVTRQTNTAADGDVELITLGYTDDPYNNGRVFHGFAVAIPEEDPAGLALVEFDADELDFRGHVEHYFEEPMNELQGDFKIKNASTVSGAYRLRAVSGTEIEEAEVSVDDKHDFVDQHVETAEIANISEHLTTLGSEGKYPADGGVDVKKVSGVINSARIGENAMYTIQDDSFREPSELPDGVRGDDDNIGLVCWLDGVQATQGEGAYVDLYGQLLVNSDGQAFMGVVGMDVVKPNELDEERKYDPTSSSSSESAGSTDADPAEERTI